MLHVTIFAVGKLKDKWLKEAINSYLKMLKGIMQIEWVFAKDLPHLTQLLKSIYYICLDEKGINLTSNTFNQRLFHHFSQKGSKISFVIGPSEGLSKEILEKSQEKWSLSQLTFPNQLVHLIFIEQLYRAIKISQNHPYPK